MEVRQLNAISSGNDIRSSASGALPSSMIVPHFGLKEKLFLSVLCILSGAPVLKLGEIQSLELLLLVHFALLLCMFMYRGLRFRVTPLWRTYGIPNAVFLCVTTLFAVAALRLPFFPIASEPSILKQPMFLSISRLIEYLLVSFYMVYVASMLQHNLRALVFSLKAYFYTGVCSALYGLVSFPVLLASGIQLGAYSPDERVRGFMNEGGPYGLYLISVVACGFMLVRLNALKSASFLTLIFVMLLPALILSQSKAAATTVVLVLGMLILLEKSVWIKTLIVVALAGVVLLVVVNENSLASYAGYFAAAIDNDAARAEDAKDEGFGGRAGSFVFLPRMIAAHPITGIGFGNYPLMRNDPTYLQGFTPVDHWDLPGSGLISYAAEFGIPLFLLLFAIVFLPLIKTVRGGAQKSIVILAAVQPICMLCGTQINFFYPWLCSSFAVAAFLTVTKAGKTIVRGNIAVP